jgi:hypothetical protein
MTSRSLRSLVACAALAPVLAQAEGLSYSYLEAGYLSTDIDAISEEVDGFTLRGSVELTERVFVFGGYTDQSASVSGLDVDAQSYALGAGYAWPLAPTTDVYGKLAYVSAEVDASGVGSADDDGYSLSLGLRGRVVEQFELEGAIHYVDLADSGDDTSFGVGARWHFTEQFAVGVEGEFGDDANTYGIGVRWTFGG